MRGLAQQGKNDEQIKDYLVARYGDFVLYNPPVKATTWLLWFGPFALLLGGGAIWALVLKRRGRAGYDDDDAPAPDREGRRGRRREGARAARRSARVTWSRAGVRHSPSFAVRPDSLDSPRMPVRPSQGRGHAFVARTTGAPPLSIYALKPQFQALLRPLARGLAHAGVTANQVTVAAAVVSVALGAFVAARAPERWPFLLIPLWMFVRMAFNAIDGMLAREHGQKSRLGAYLNELTDVVSDAALYLPFALIAAVLAAVDRHRDRPRGRSPSSPACWAPWWARRAATTARWARATARSCSARSACGSASRARFRTGPHT